MKATLKLTNIGQREGEENWDFNSGVLTEIRGRMAVGKSRILKSCALALSIPIVSQEIRDTAISFGIAKASGAKTSPLLNHNKDQAIIELKYNDEEQIVHLNRDGVEKYNSPGNQKFIYCSMLVENSRIHNYVSTGKSDFSWIVTEMSLAKDYEVIEGIVNSYNELLISKEEEIKKKNVGKEKNQELLSKKNQELNNVLSELKKTQEEIAKIDIDPKLRTQYSTLDEELNKLKKDQENNKTQLKEKEQDLSKIENTIQKNDNVINQNSVEIDKLATEKNKLEEIDIQLINKRIQEILKENGDLRESRGKLDEKIKALEIEIKELHNIHKELLKTSEEEVLCWTCKDGHISKTSFEKKFEEKKKEKEEAQKKWDTLNKKIKKNDEEHQNQQKEKEKKNRLSEIDKEKEDLSREIGKLGTERNQLDAKVKTLKGDIQMYSANIKSRITKVQQKEKDFKIIEEKLRENEKMKPKLKIKDQLTKKLGAIEHEIENLEEEIHAGIFIELLGFQIDISKFNTIIINLRNIFSKINDYVALNKKEQKEGAAKKFNENIEKILKELNLPRIEKVYLDINEDNNLKIIRKGNPEPHELNTLSGGERVVISSLLQISAKETYNSEIPFIIGDDLILKMDEEARGIFYNYLRRIAKKYDWFIILSRVTNEDLVKEEI
jgi:DNA repair exonuclease SbcCD ATPase subunit